MKLTNRSLSGFVKTPSQRVFHRRQFKYSNPLGKSNGRWQRVRAPKKYAAINFYFTRVF